MKKITLQDISKKFKLNEQIIDKLNYAFEKGKTYALCGVSGCGKSTLLHIIAGIEAPTSGHVRDENQSITDLSEQEKDAWRQKNIGLLFQLPFLIKELSVVDNILLPGTLTKNPDKKWALELLAAVGLSDKADMFPATLSGGEQHRVALARALYHKPAFLLADEPTGNLDPAMSKEICNLILSCAQQWNMGVIVSTHDMALADMMDYKLKLVNGKLSNSATRCCEQIFSN